MNFCIQGINAIGGRHHPPNAQANNYGFPLPLRGRRSMRMVKRCRCTPMGIQILMTLRKNQVSKNVLPVNNRWW
ncbi:hypothetical protein CY34DRAFT_694366 [Suillus luteus UH-Slu-Lm8-n1]|uniref:Uncharacterized protein n=1 Tax=Suillus luteus UH-Slu-Lm8-n1 TaxID=930992 RepID=A0A0D0AH74_9AGAM|nr:hypothetical protein CY34DRAFT_694366 [Suillus luteus UH-Slu-Lm8-n1]